MYQLELPSLKCHKLEHVPKPPFLSVLVPETSKPPSQPSLSTLPPPFLTASLHSTNQPLPYLPSRSHTSHLKTEYTSPSIHPSSLPHTSSIHLLPLQKNKYIKSTRPYHLLTNLHHPKSRIPHRTPHLHVTKPKYQQKISSIFHLPPRRPTTAGLGKGREGKGRKENKMKRDRTHLSCCGCLRHFTPYISRY